MQLSSDLLFYVAYSQRLVGFRQQLTAAVAALGTAGVAAMWGRTEQADVGHWTWVEQRSTKPFKDLPRKFHELERLCQAFVQVRSEGCPRLIDFFALARVFVSFYESSNDQDYARIARLGALALERLEALEHDVLMLASASLPADPTELELARCRELEARLARHEIFGEASELSPDDIDSLLAACEKLLRRQAS